MSNPFDPAIAPRLAVVLGFSFCLTHAYAGVPPAAPQSPSDLAAQKTARTPAQRKISADLLREAERRRNDPGPEAASLPGSAVRVDEDGTTVVDITADVTSAVLEAIEAAAGEVLNSHPRFRAIRARLPLLRLEEIARLMDVSSIRAADLATTHDRPPR